MKSDVLIYFQIESKILGENDEWTTLSFEDGHYKQFEKLNDAYNEVRRIKGSIEGEQFRIIRVAESRIEAMINL